MKFGKRLALEAERSTGGAANFIDYASLKAAIKVDAASKDPAAAAFAAALLAELRRVSELTAAREEELAAAVAAAAAAPADDVALAGLRARLRAAQKRVVLNYIAVCKAVKKRNRHAPWAPRLAAGDVLTSPAARFATSPVLADLATRAELLAAAPAPAPEEFQCAICIDLLRAPVVLPCAHRFCWACVVTHASTTRAARAAPVAVDKPGAKPAAAAAAALAATWAGDGAGADARFGCPCCRRETRLDLDRLAVDSPLAEFVAALAPAPAAHLVLEPAAAHLVLEPAERPLLPPQRPEHAGRLTVCLDLDGTLIASFPPARAPLGVGGYVVGRGSRLNPKGVFVVERPGLGRFLRRLAAVAEVVLFTAGQRDYASPIVDALEARHGVALPRLYRDATVEAPAYPCVKDLSRLGRPPGRAVLVDDTPLAFARQPDAGVPVLPFRGDADDRLLAEAVLPLLEGLCGAAGADARPALAARFGMRAWLAAQGVAEADAADAAEAAASAAAAARSDDGDDSDDAAAPAAPGALLFLTDFDLTLTNQDAGEAVAEALAPELLALVAGCRYPQSFVAATNAMLAEAARRGSGPAAIEAALAAQGAAMPAGATAALRAAAAAGADVRVLSDANSVFVGRVLAAAGVAGCVRGVVTNAARFVATAASARLVVAPRHDASALGPHGCAQCPPNICKGREVDAMRARGPRKVVYAGDGSNDLCPSLRLGEGDCVLARRGHALAAALTGSHAGCVAARVRLWSTHDELHALVREEVGSAA